MYNYVVYDFTRMSKGEKDVLYFEMESLSVPSRIGSSAFEQDLMIIWAKVGIQALLLLFMPLSSHDSMLTTRSNCANSV